MKVAVSATGNTLDAPVNPRFGRCEYFIIVNTDDMSYDAFPNENAGLSSGAGIQSASFAASQGVAAVLTGNCGPKAAQTFAAANIDVFTGYSGTVRQAVEQFAAGGTSPQQPQSFPGAAPSAESTVWSRPGMGGGRCRGGSGRRMGGGGGMGMGGGGMRRMPSSSTAAPSTASTADDLAALKEQAARLKTELEQIQKKIDDLE